MKLTYLPRRFAIMTSHNAELSNEFDLWDFTGVPQLLLFQRKFLAFKVEMSENRMGGSDG